MQLRLRDFVMQAIQGWISVPQFTHQPIPFVFKLPFGHYDPRTQRLPVELRAVELISPVHRLLVNSRQVQVDRSARSAARAKALELRVMAVADGPSVKNV